MPKNNTKSVLRALLKRKNAPKWVKKKRNQNKTNLNNGKLILEREQLANFLIANQKELSSDIFKKLPKRWFDSKGIIRPKHFSSSNKMLQMINASAQVV